MRGCGNAYFTSIKLAIWLLVGLRVPVCKYYGVATHGARQCTLVLRTVLGMVDHDGSGLHDVYGGWPPGKGLGTTKQWGWQIH